MTAWDMWDSVPEVLLKLLSQPQALSPEAFPAVPSLTCCSLPPQLLYPPGSPTADTGLGTAPQGFLALTGVQAAPGPNCFPHI